MILTVTANVAIDRTYVIDRLQPGTVHKVTRAYAHIGGKGVNVSRCLRSLGADTLVTGMIGGAGLADASADLAAAGLDSSLFAVAGAARQTVTVTAQDGSTTAFDEAGPNVSDQDWAGFEQHFAGLLEPAQMVVIAGSLPPGTPEPSLANLCEQANRHSVPVILDARGAAMRAAQERRPLVAKLNRNELGQTLGREISGEEDALEGALELRALGARHVVVTLGERGAIGVGEELWRVTHPSAGGNPIGAGDAFSAALALALAGGEPFEHALTEGAAAALASLSTPTAGGTLDPGELERARRSVQTQPMERVVAR
jgi:tagatose 6-phosphate kinase